MSSDAMTLIQAVINDKLRTFKTAELGIVTNVYSRESSADKNNYECDVRLRRPLTFLLDPLPTILYTSAPYL